LAIDAFNLSEEYRIPVMFMMDECVGHMMEKVVIPPADEIEVYPRRYTKLPPEKYLPYEIKSDDLVPDMVKAGDGYRFHTTGLTHDERGYPVMSADCQEVLVSRLVAKIRNAADKLTNVEEDGIDGADVVVISYGITSRVATRAVLMAREKGMKVGLLRLITVWPFPEKKIRELAKKINAFCVAEMNYGQIYYEVDRLAKDNCGVVLAPHGGGTVHNPEAIYEKIVEAAKWRKK
jgi:2-oxoglutarate ferredoxin oxidoreductase subunit alpha